MSRRLRDYVRPTYALALDAFFDAPAPIETRATCERCVMLPPEHTPQANQLGYFLPDTKCCTYQPTLSNFALGELLADSSARLDEGRRRVRARIASRQGVTPYHLAPPKKQALLHEASRLTSLGRTRLLRCPFYDNGSCSIWPYHDATCSTWFCKNDAAADGKDFWELFQRYQHRLDAQLAIWAVDAVAPELPLIEENLLSLTLEELEERAPDQSWYTLIWGEWGSREEEFYRRCHAAVRALSGAQLLKIVDAEEDLVALREVLRDSYQQVMDPVLPDCLVLNQTMWRAPAAEGQVLVRSYSRFDPLLLDEAALAALATLRPDEPATVARQRLAQEADLELDDATWLMLYRYRVLVPPPSAPAP